MAGEYIRDTQTAIEVLRSGDTSLLIRNTQTVVEVLMGGGSNVRCTQSAIEILREWISLDTEQPRVVVIT